MNINFNDFDSDFPYTHHHGNHQYRNCKHPEDEFGKCNHRHYRNCKHPEDEFGKCNHHHRHHHKDCKDHNDYDDFHGKKCHRDQFYGPYGRDFDELSDEEFRNFCHRRQKMIREMRKNGEFSRGFGPRWMDDEGDGKKQRLQPLSIRVKPHTKKFLKEDSVLSAREILELYEDFANGSEEYVLSLEEDEEALKEELSKLEDKIKNAKSFTDNLENLKSEEKGAEEDDEGE
ncbi:hypothetical protein Abm4_0990 [Methanobrevibacter sp. AbM4]|nr:hypothetical protein Abm4_0990 [Methanobrevibacter sp. AbM4]